MNPEPVVNWGMIGRIFAKAIVLFAVANLLLMMVLPLGVPGTISLYNWLWPGRERLPFGEDMTASYNLSLSNLDAMFASHIIAAPKSSGEFRVVVLGDSSVWGTLLQPDETLPAQLENELVKQLQDETLNVRVYNLGYPTMSLLKDLIMLDYALQYEPDMIIWSVTLQSFPENVQSESAIVQQNALVVNQLNEKYPGLVLSAPDLPAKTDANFIQQQRYLADLYRLQLLGFMWGATGIDQVYPEQYTPARVDYEVDEKFGIYEGPILPQEKMALKLLNIGKTMAGDIPLIIVNEPIMISNGENSDIRYNYYYPRWAYDDYHAYLMDYCKSSEWVCLDYWNILPMDSFTNTAVHYSAKGATSFSQNLAEDLINQELFPIN